MAPKKRTGTGLKATTSGPRGSRRRVRSPSPPPLSPMPYPLENSEHMTRYQVLHNRTIVPSKFFDPYAVNHLGLAREVRRLLDNVGWGRFYSIQAPTYKELTLEFLSSFDSTYVPFGDPDAQCVTFRCMGIDRSLTLGEFNAIFGLPNSGSSWFSPHDFNSHMAWSALTRGTGVYSASQAKASQLHSPAMRYIHRVMTSSLFGKGESTGVLGHTEVLFLWAMQNRIPINTGVWILKHLLHVSHHSRGKICVGGLITVIAQSFGFHPIPDVYHVIPGSFLVDFEMLARMRMVRSVVGGGYRLIDGDVEEEQQEEAQDEPQEEAQDEPQEGAQDEPQAYPEEAAHIPQAPASSRRHAASSSQAGPSDASYDQILYRLERLEIGQERLELGQTRLESGQDEILRILRRMESRRVQSDSEQSDSDD